MENFDIHYLTKSNDSNYGKSISLYLICYSTKQVIQIILKEFLFLLQIDVDPDY